MTVIYNGPLTLPTETQLPVTTVTYVAKTKLIVVFIGGAGDYDKFSGIGPSHIMGKRQAAYVSSLYSKFKNVTISGDIYNNDKHAVELECVYPATANEKYRVRCYYYGYDKAESALYEKIKADLLDQQRSEVIGIIIVGHSLGGWKAAKLSEKLEMLKECPPIDLLATLDPVGETYFTVLQLESQPKPNVKFWMNVSSHGIAQTTKYVKEEPQNVPLDLQHPTFKKESKFNFDNLVASAGNRWDLDGNKIVNINIVAPEIGHADASKMMRTSAGRVSINSKMAEITKSLVGV